MFRLWERTVQRCFDAGLITNSIGPARTAAVIWATLNGAFTLLGDENFFRKLTGLNPRNLVEDVRLSAELYRSFRRI